jgi:SAM-dependent methyltransferase
VVVKAPDLPVVGTSPVVRTPTPPGISPAVVWHELECGSYRADLPLWRELAERCDGPILDVGAGTGRVTLELARAGRRVTALERDPALLARLRERADDLHERADGLQIEAVCADARDFVLARRDFALCVVPMQTLQLLGGAAGRGAFLRRAHAHLRPRGLLACALVTELDPFDVAHGSPGPSPETARVGEELYVNRAMRVGVRAHEIVLEYERVVLGPDVDVNAHAKDTADAPTPRRADGRAGDTPGACAPRRVIVTLDRVSVAQLEREAHTAAGFRPEPARSIAPTAEHAGSEVAVLRA